MDTVRIHLLDGPDVAQMERLLHVKVEVFLHEDEVDLLAIPAEKRRDGIKSIAKNWSRAGFEETGRSISDAQLSHL